MEVSFIAEKYGTGWINLEHSLTLFISRFIISEKSTALGKNVSVSRRHAKVNQRSDEFVKLVRRVRHQGGLNGQGGNVITLGKLGRMGKYARSLLKRRLTTLPI